MNPYAIPHHKWQRVTRREVVEGVEQDVKDCSACGMSRTKDRSTKSLDVFRAKGADRWQGYKAGHIPSCRPQVKP